MKDLKIDFIEWLIPEYDRTRGFDQNVALLTVSYGNQTHDVEVDLTQGKHRSSLGDKVRGLDKFSISEILEDIMLVDVESFAEEKWQEYKTDNFKAISKSYAKRLLEENNLDGYKPFDDFVENFTFYLDFDLLLACEENERYINKYASPYSTRYSTILSIKLDNI